jgi:hypothetical protein
VHKTLEKVKLVVICYKHIDAHHFNAADLLVRRSPVAGVDQWPVAGAANEKHLGFNNHTILCLIV